MHDGYYSIVAEIIDWLSVSITRKTPIDSPIWLSNLPVIFMKSVVLLFAIIYPVLIRDPVMANSHFRRSENYEWSIFTECYYQDTCDFVACQWRYHIAGPWWVSLNLPIPGRYGSNLEIVIFGCAAVVVTPRLLRLRRGDTSAVPRFWWHFAFALVVENLGVCWCHSHGLKLRISTFKIGRLPNGRHAIICTNVDQTT